jgi:hypothetical protein
MELRKNQFFCEFALTPPPFGVVLRNFFVPAASPACREAL